MGLWLAGLVVLWWERRVEPWKWAVGSEHPLVIWVERTPLFGVHLGVVAWPFWGQKN